jgi:hypothetical protein
MDTINCPSIPSMLLKPIKAQLSLRDVLSPDLLCAALRRHPEIAAQLVQYLPEGSPSDINTLCEHVRSAPFQQTVDMFNHAMLSGELAGLMVSMGLPANVGGFYGGGVQGFLNAVQNQADQQKKDNKDDKMDESS